MVGADKTTELWRPLLVLKVYVIVIDLGLLLKRISKEKLLLARRDSLEGWGEQLC